MDAKDATDTALWKIEEIIRDWQYSDELPKCVRRAIAYLHCR